MKTSRSLIIHLLFLVAFALPAAALEIGQTAPGLSLPSLAGATVDISGFKGRIVVLKLATTWCPTCTQQTEEIDRIKDYLQENDVAVVEVFIQDSEKMVRDYFAGRDLSADRIVLLDDGSAVKSYNVYLIPRVLLIDREFKVRRDGSLIGAEELKKGIGQLIAK
ncbi:MAG: TlpA disulfide reductase family protein [Desulfuromonadales bacterium]